MLELRHIVKRFGATTAVDDVSLTIARGEIVGLVGENGAGKTTLMRIAAGEITPDHGEVQRGTVGFVHQHFTLVPEFTIAENLALATSRTFRFTSRAALEREARQTIATSGIRLDDVSRRAGDLAVGEKAKLELIKAVALRPEVLILDEPTSVLTPIETSELFDVIRGLGTAVVFISHKVREVVEIAQRVVVMRGGRVVAEGTGMTASEIADAMVARVRTPSPPGSPPTLESRSHGARVSSPAQILSYENLTLHPGEIVAIVGVAGNGQSELVEHLRTTLTGRVGFIPEDRTRDALVEEMSIAENLALGAATWRRSDAVRNALNLIALYRIRARGPWQHAGELSGGNQQKVVLAKWLATEPRILIMDEPTRGIDVGAKSEIHALMSVLAARGLGILMISSELPEVLGMSDRVLVMKNGTLVAEFDRAQATAESVGTAMTLANGANAGSGEAA